MSTLTTILSDEDTGGEEAVETQETIEETPEVTAEPEPEAPEPEAPAPEPEPRTVPLQALQEERAKRQELEARMSALEGAQQAPEPAPVPDMLEDPEGYKAWQQQQLRLVQLNAFEESARDVHGDEAVEEAYRAFQGVQGSPEAAAIVAAKNPWRAMMQWHKKRAAAENFDPEAERAKIKAEIMAELQASKPAAPPPPPSLARATNLGDRTTREIDESALSLDDILGNPAA